LKNSDHENEKIDDNKSFLMICQMHIILIILVMIAKKIHHFDIHDQRIWENLEKKSKGILV